MKKDASKSGTTLSPVVYGEQQKDINQQMFFMRKIGIRVQIKATNAETSELLDFHFNFFDKGKMIDYDEDPPKVKPKYTSYTLQILNRFFAVVSLTKMEIFQVRYDNKDLIVEVVQRYSKKSFLDAFQPVSVFLKYWLSSVHRRQYRKYEFNLFLGMNIQLNAPKGLV